MDILYTSISLYIRSVGSLTKGMIVFNGTFHGSGAINENLTTPCRAGVDVVCLSGAVGATGHSVEL